MGKSSIPGSPTSGYPLNRLNFMTVEHRRAFRTVFFCRRSTHLLLLLRTGPDRLRAANLTGIDLATLKRYACLADLMRVPSVGYAYADLLHTVGVNSVRQLKHLNYINLTNLIYRELDRPGTQFCFSQMTPERVKGWIGLAHQVEVILDLS